MKRKRRYDRYVATIRQDGLFLIDLDSYLGGEDQEYPLNPCQNCLDELNYKNFKNISYRQKQDIVHEFDYEAFLEDYSVFFENRPRHTDETALPAKYIENWSALSLKTRENASWICKGCGVDCSSVHFRKWLHVHHINGIKSDNRAPNLEVLCLLCHAAQPGHTHMRIPPQARTELQERRQVKLT